MGLIDSDQTSVYFIEAKRYFASLLPVFPGAGLEICHWQFIVLPITTHKRKNHFIQNCHQWQ